jgi:glutaredoxin
VDHVPCLQAWQESLNGITYPLLSDFWPHGKVARQYDVFIEDAGKSERAIFIIDKTGVIRYIDVHDIDEQPDNDVLLAELKKIIPNAGPALNKLYVERAEEEGGVLMPCTPWCPDCPKARKWLKENNIDYTEIDISRDLNAARQVRSWGDGYQITPVFNINGEIIIDFKKEELAKLLLNK